VPGNLPVSDRDDRVLVDRVAHAGDERAFAELYDRHTPYLYRLALRLGAGDEALAAEVVHEGWVRAIERLPAFEWRSALRTWLAGFVVTVNREQARETREVTLTPDGPATDDRTQGATWDRLDLERAIAALPAGYRQVLVLHDVEGYTHAEIGALLGLDAGTSKSQLARARQAMRNALTAREEKGAARDR
jgi:RNA polymerase sigma-70 factor (ECF subfamily)